MAKACAFTGKTIGYGNQKTYRGKAKYLGGVGKKITGISRRKVRPNLQKVKCVIDGVVVRTWGFSRRDPQRPRNQADQEVAFRHYQRLIKKSSLGIERRWGSASAAFDLAFPEGPFMSLSLNEVRKVAKLARLEIAEADLATMAEQLNRILGYVDQLSSVNTDGVEPMAHPLPLSNVFRDDVPVPSLPVDAALQNAPNRLADFFGVPAVFDSDEPVSH